MSQCVGQCVGHCNLCLQTKAQRHLPVGKLQLLPIPEDCWNTISIDFILELPEMGGYCKGTLDRSNPRYASLPPCHPLYVKAMPCTPSFSFLPFRSCMLSSDRCRILSWLPFYYYSHALMHT